MSLRFVYRLPWLLAVSTMLSTGCEPPGSRRPTPVAPASKSEFSAPKEKPRAKPETPLFELPKYHPEEEEAILALRPLRATIPLNAEGKAEKVYLSRSKTVTDADLVHLQALTELNELTLTDTNISDAALENLAHLPKLEILSLQGTQVTGEGLVHLQQLPLLSKLYTSNTSLEDDGLALLSEMTQLKELHISYTPITDEGLKHLAGLKNLVYLDLSWTGITDEGLMHLQGLASLREIDLHETKVTDEGVEKFRQALPTIGKIHR